MQGRTKLLLASALGLALLAAVLARSSTVEGEREEAIVATDGVREPAPQSNAGASHDFAERGSAKPAGSANELDAAAPTRRAVAIAPAAGAPRPRAQPPPGARRAPGRVVIPHGTPADERLVVRATTSHGARPWNDRCRAEVAADGSFELWLAEGERIGSADLEARYLFLEQPAWLDADGVLVLEPELGGRVHGRVTGLEHAEADEVEVSLIGEFRMSYAQSSSQADGRFELAAVEPAGSLRALAWAGGFVRARAGPFAIAPGEAVEVELELGPPAALTGRVVDADGVALGDVRITARALVDEPPYPRIPETTTDASGAFSLAALPAEAFELTLEHVAQRTHRVQVERLASGERREGLLVTLERGAGLAGLALLPDGSPASGARVVARSRSADGAVSGMERVDADEAGRFRFGDLVGTDCTLTAELEADRTPRARAERFSARLERVALPADDLRLVLASGETLAGRVLDDAGEPVSSFRLKLEPGAGVGDGPLGTTWARLFRAPDGRFELAGVERGEWRIEASSTWHAEAVLERVTVPSGAPLELRLARKAELAGRVRTPDGRPAAGARVEAGPVTGGRTEGAGARARSDGTFEGLDLPPGTFRVLAKLGGFAPSLAQLVSVSAGEERGGLDLVLRPPARLVVAVTRADGRPASRCVVGVELPEGGTSSGLADLRGERAFEDLPPGSYEVSATIYPEGYQQETPVLRSGSARRPPRASAEVTLTEGQEARLELTPLPPGEERDG